MKVPVSAFGKDHWSLLAYLETCVVDPADSRLTQDRGGVAQLPAMIGQVNKERLRCNPRRHPLHAVLGDVRCAGWKPDYGTRLAGFSTDPEKRIPSHDDWDCMDDLERAGFIEVVSEANGLFKITDVGISATAQLRAHKCRGGQFSNYVHAAAA